MFKDIADRNEITRLLNITLLKVSVTVEEGQNS